MAEFSAFVTLALAEVAALQSVMSILVILPAVALVAGSLFWDRTYDWQGKDWCSLPEEEP